MTTVTTKPTIQHPYVTRRTGVCGGKPIIAGTRIKVSFVAREYVEMGMTPKEIAAAHPQLTLAQIHDALSYYYDHEAEIQAELRDSDELVEQLREEAGPSPVAERLRAEGKLRPTASVKLPTHGRGGLLPGVSLEHSNDTEW